MHLAFSWQKLRVPLSNSYNYTPEELEHILHRHTYPYWLVVEGTAIRLEQACVALACRVMSLDHNAYTLVEDDGFQQDMAGRERAVTEHMLEDSSSDEESVTSTEDMVFEREVYM